MHETSFIFISEMTALYILAFLFIALLAFVYLLNRQYISIVKHLTSRFSELKAFTLGTSIQEPERAVTLAEIQEQVDEDFGEILPDKEKQKPEE